VIIGGGWSVAGIVAGAVVLVGIPSYLSGFSGAWPGAVFGLLLVVAALFAPSGLEGSLGGVYRNLLRRRLRTQREKDSSKDTLAKVPTSTVH
jgi:hypothetical protein